MFMDTIIKSRIKTRAAQQSSVYRSIAKTISWRILGTLDTIIISYLLTGTLSIALSIGAVELISKMVLYYAHERVWERFPMSKSKNARVWRPK
jgi:uncharacterized membrane protein